MQTLISGFGCVCSLGDDTKEITKNLFSNNIKPSFALGRLDSSFVGEYPVFQVSNNILKQKKDNETYSFLFLRKALEEALEKSDLTIDELTNIRLGVCIGTSVDASFNCFNFYKQWRKQEHKSLEPLNRTMVYSTAQEVLNYLNLKGIAQTIVTACASGTDAIGTGAQWIENDLCDIVIAGGTDELDLIPFTGFIKLMVASKEPCKPFDKNRKGINLGEGAGICILESKKNALKRKMSGGGIVLGYGTACDGYHITSPHPEGRGLRKSLDFALNQAQIKKAKIAFINAHATASNDNDAVEAKVYNSLLSEIPVSATKGFTGHTLGAAGAVEACLTLICLNEKRIPKTNNFDTADEKLNLVPVTKNTDIVKNVAISSSLSFGGCNSVLVLGGKDYE